MKIKLFRYASEHPFSMVITIALFALAVYFSKGIFLLVWLLNLSLSWANYNQRVDYARKNGLTDEEHNNNLFIEKWTKIKEAGLAKYCFYDGGIILGSGLSIFIGAVFFKSGLLGDVTKDFSGMMEVIWKSFVIGFIIASAINRLRWPYQEKRFTKLTGSYFEMKA